MMSSAPYDRPAVSVPDPANFKVEVRACPQGSRERKTVRTTARARRRGRIAMLKLPCERGPAQGR
jgi:hypothetical protein